MDGFDENGNDNFMLAVDDSRASCHYIKSFRHYTREALPRLEHYNHLDISGPHRPSVSNLLATHHDNPDKKDAEEGLSQLQASEGVKFGWIRGVYIKVILNVWGLILFLRLSWVVGQAGIGLAIVIMALSNIVTIITTLSMSAVSTNGAIKGGGIYYMISRSLGPEFGGSIGLLFTISSSVSTGMLGIGFAESMLDLLKQCGYPEPMIDGDINDKRIIGSGILILLLAITFVGMEMVAKTEFILLIVLVAAQVDFVVGCIIGPQDDEERAKGMTGFKADTINSNWGPKFKDYNGQTQSFFTVFAVFFPAVNGIVAGANVSGDLKDPSTAIPKGTLLGVSTTFVSYVGLAFVFGASVLRETTGNVIDYYAGNFTSACDHVECEHGLYSQQAMTIASGFDGLIYAGCFAATTSSAIANIVGAPRVLQALAKDRIFPYLHFFEKSYGRSKDPLRGYVLCFGIAIACVCIGDVNAVATISTTIYLTAYGLINFAVFHAELNKSPGWRPSFKYFSAWLSLPGCLLCIAVMFLINWWMSLITIGFVFGFLLVVIYLKPSVNWGSSAQSQSYILALKGAQNLLKVNEHVKNYRPQVLVLSGHPSTRPPLVDFGNLLTKNISLLVTGHIMKPPLSTKDRNVISQTGYSWLSKHNITGFYSIITDDDLGRGVAALCQTSGLGKLRPNLVLLGFKSDWMNCSREELKSYFLTLHDTINLHLGLAILRVPEGFDYTHTLKKKTQDKVLEKPIIVVSDGESSSDDDSDSSSDNTESTESKKSSLTTEETEPKVAIEEEKIKKKPKKRVFKRRERTLSYFASKYEQTGGDKPSKEVLHNLTRFRRKQEAKGFIDVWWLYDDGGLTLLLPYILTTRSQYKECQLRIFSIASKKDALGKEQAHLASLLSKLRIEHSEVTVIPDIGQKADSENLKNFDNLIADFHGVNNEDGCSITEAELSSLKEKTNRHIRLRELLLMHSKNANLIVMTLPMPRKGAVSPPLYMAWLETLTKDMPPFLLVRGNQTSVLTCYS